MPNRLVSQAEIQRLLTDIQRKHGLSEALNALYQWEYEAGYISDSKLHDNLRYAYHDREFNLTFKAQINIARSRYSPQPLSGKNIPLLHCPICFENIGLPGKENLRVFEFKLSGKPFFAQLTPFPLYPKHFVLVSRAQTPMIMNEHSIADMLDFLEQAPHYTVFSNSDVEWAGASILAHHHYQAIEHLRLPITEASFVPPLSWSDQKGTTIGVLNFPIAAGLIKSTSPEKILHYGKKIIENWRTLDPQNTCNLALHQTSDNGLTRYFLYIIFRHPNFRTPPHLTCIKSEGVGVIEVCGEGIYPVPQSPDMAEKIQNEGLSVIKEIIEGNSPIKRQNYNFLFEQIMPNPEIEIPS